MKIAVIGGGIFGATAAIRLARGGFDVSLFEREPDILQAASGINQYRLHRGYHYPRSKETALSSKNAKALFHEEYSDAVIDSHRHFYAIAKEGTRVSGSDFIEFCNACELEHEHVQLPHLNPHMVETVIEGDESLVDPIKLKAILSERIAESGVQLFTGREFRSDDIDGFDMVVNCAYANLNSVLERFPEAKRNYQFELCEKPVLKLPESFAGISLVIMDGPFTCIDPYADTGFHVMGNVVHAIHSSNTGPYPYIPEEFAPLLNKGIVRNPPKTNIEKFIEFAAQFMPDVAKAEHIGSMYTFRTVLPNVEKTDERPTLVYRVNEKIINVFSGKIGNSVKASIEVERQLSEERERRSYTRSESIVL